MRLWAKSFRIWSAKPKITLQPFTITRPAPLLIVEPLIFMARVMDLAIQILERENAGRSNRSHGEAVRIPRAQCRHRLATHAPVEIHELIFHLSGLAPEELRAFVETRFCAGPVSLALEREWEVARRSVEVRDATGSTTGQHFGAALFCFITIISAIVYAVTHSPCIDAGSVFAGKLPKKASWILSISRAAISPISI